MELATSLYTGRLVRLTRIEYDKDPETISVWTQQSAFLRALNVKPVQLLSPPQVRKQLEKIEKSVESEKNIFYFHIRPLQDERLVGCAKIYWINWPSGVGMLQFVIGPSEQKKGYGADALALLLRFAFDELNLYRLMAILPEYNLAAIHLARKFGFMEEIRQRESIEREGRRWDALSFGLLRHEWSGQKVEEK